MGHLHHRSPQELFYVGTFKTILVSFLKKKKITKGHQYLPSEI